MSTKNTNIKAVFYCDGSCIKNPGYAGSGVFGYTYSEVSKAKNYKHPYYENLYFTPEGISKEKSRITIEVHDIIEVIEAINNPASTNNKAELVAVINALKKAKQIDNLKEITILTDSNYIVSSFNESIEKWKENNWKRIDNKLIVHLKDWEFIDEFNTNFIKNGGKLNIKWVKGHSGNYGNTIADIYSVIGSNAAKQLENNNPIILDQVISYNDYKKSYKDKDKDFVFYFRDLYFSSDKLNDVNYCFLSTSDDPNILGKRNNSSIFVTNIGYVPPVINKIKEFYRSIERNYTITCCIKIGKLDNKDIYRLTELIQIKYLLIKASGKIYRLVGDEAPFLFENGIGYPFIVNASNLFNRMEYINSILDKQYDNIFKFDITNFITDSKTKKLKVTNKDKYIDFTEHVKNQITFKQNLIIKIGYDMPNFLALKNIEKDIEKVNLIIESNIDNNFCTVYINIVAKNRNIFSVNINNKYLKT